MERLSEKEIKEKVKKDSIEFFKMLGIDVIGAVGEEGLDNMLDEIEKKYLGEHGEYSKVEKVILHNEDGEAKELEKCVIITMTEQNEEFTSGELYKHNLGDEEWLNMLLFMKDFTEKQLALHKKKPFIHRVK